MRLAEFSVKRPITTIMMMLICLVLGGLALWQLTVELMPKLTFPNIMVFTEYAGVAPEEIEKLVTKPLETAVKSVPRIKIVKSQSKSGVSVINAEFTWGTNLDESTNQIRDRINQIKSFLPNDISDPIIYKIEVNIPVGMMSLRGSDDLAMLQKIMEDVIQPKIERLDGVAGVFAVGGRDREIQVNIDRNKIANLGISLEQIVMKIRAENINISAGTISDSAEKEFTVRGIGEFKKIEELEKIVVALKGSTPIYLRDIGEIIDGYADEKGISRVNRIRSVTIMIQKETDANTVQVSNRIKAILPKIRSELPKDLTFDFVFDTSEMIMDSINALKNSAIEGAILAAIIIFIFLGKLKPTLIICISIPISILIALTSMYFTNSTINIMTLGGLVLALGRLVDDSIVVMENIFRHRQLGKDSFSAAVDGAKEVGIAVISSTLVSVVVFLPIVFATGIAAQLFKQFGAVVFYSLMGSLFVAFTIVPMLSSKLFKKEIKIEDKKNYYEKVKKFYEKSLGYALSHKLLITGISVFLLVITVILFKNIGKEFIPQLISGNYQAYVKQPLGSTLESTNNLALKIEDTVHRKVPDLENLGGFVGTSRLGARMAAMSGNVQGTEGLQMFIRLKKGNERKTSEKELFNIFDKIARENPGAEIRLTTGGSQLLGSGTPVEVKIYGNDIDTLKLISSDLLDKMKNIDGLKNISSSIEKGLPEFTLNFNREKIAKYGLTIGQINQIVKIAIDGQVASIYRESGEEVDIRVRLKQEHRKIFKDLLNLPINSPFGFIFTLRDVVEINYTEGPGIIRRENSKRVAVISADISGRKLSGIVNDVNKNLRKISFPEGYFYEFGGQEKDRSESFKVLLIALLMSLLIVYMILASLYESLIHPFTILLSVPFAFTGAIFALYISGVGLGVTAFIGLITLVGIVTTNAIIMIDFIIKRREEVKDRRKAIIQAATIRLRPVLMTALTTLFGLLPVALGRAEGMELQIPLGIAVVGGLFSSTFLTLYIIPVVYEIFDSVHFDLR